MNTKRRRVYEPSKRTNLWTPLFCLFFLDLPLALGSLQNLRRERESLTFASNPQVQTPPRRCQQNTAKKKEFAVMSSAIKTAGARMCCTLIGRQTDHRKRWIEHPVCLSKMSIKMSIKMSTKTE